MSKNTNPPLQKISDQVSKDALKSPNFLTQTPSPLRKNSKIIARYVKLELNCLFWEKRQSCINIILANFSNKSNVCGAIKFKL